MSDSVVLTSVGSSFHHCGPKIEKSCYLADQPLLALSDGGTRCPADMRIAIMALSEEGKRGIAECRQHSSDMKNRV